MEKKDRGARKAADIPGQPDAVSGTGAEEESLFSILKKALSRPAAEGKHGTQQ